MTDPIQQALIAARKKQILDAAAAVFAEKGFHPTTIRDIAKHAGIADGTIYNYFENKSMLLIGIFEQMRETVVAEQMPPPANLDAQSFVQAFLRQPLTGLKCRQTGPDRGYLTSLIVAGFTKSCSLSG